MDFFIDIFQSNTQMQLNGCFRKDLRNPLQLHVNCERDWAVIGSVDAGTESNDLHTFLVACWCLTAPRSQARVCVIILFNHRSPQFLLVAWNHVCGILLCEHSCSRFDRPQLLLVPLNCGFHFHHCMFLESVYCDQQHLGFSNLS